MPGIKAIIWPLGAASDDEIDNSLPGGFGGGRPDNSLPGSPGRPNNDLPSNPPVGTWPPRPRPWPPHPPIFIPPDDGAGISLPIYLPGTPGVWPPLPPVEVEPGRPSNPIVLPPLPEVGVTLAVIIPLPMAAPKDGQPPGTQAAILWYGPGTVPQLAYLGAVAEPK